MLLSAKNSELLEASNTIKVGVRHELDIAIAIDRRRAILGVQHLLQRQRTPRRVAVVRQQRCQRYLKRRVLVRRYPISSRYNRRVALEEVNSRIGK